MNVKLSTLTLRQPVQTKLHESICQKRTVATIATHDAKFLPDSLVAYDAADPTLFSVGKGIRFPTPSTKSCFVSSYRWQ